MTVKILFVSDKHCGSMGGLMPNRVKLYDPSGSRRRAIASPDQMKLYKAWKAMIRTVGPVDMVIDGGDGCDGTAWKDRGMGQWSTNIHDQVQCNLTLLKMLRFRNKPDYVIAKGSGYHANKNPSGDMLTAEELGLGMLHYGPEILLEVEGKRIHISHRIGVSTSMYRATALSREKVMDLMTKDIKKYKSDLLLRGHAHYYYQIRDIHGSALICPCWQYRTDYMASIGIALQPEIGYIYLEVAKDGIYIEPHVYPIASPIRRVKK